MLPVQVHYPCLKQVHLLLCPLHLLVDLKHVHPKTMCRDLRIATPPLHRGETILQTRLQNPGAAVQYLYRCTLLRRDPPHLVFIINQVLVVFLLTFACLVPNGV